MIYSLVKQALAAPFIENPIPGLGVTGKEGLNNIIKSVINLAVAVAGVVFLVMLLFGGIRYISAGGDEKAVASAQKTIFNALIGLILVVASFALAQLIFRLLGISGVSIK